MMLGGLRCAEAMAWGAEGRGKKGRRALEPTRKSGAFFSGVLGDGQVSASFPTVHLANAIIHGQRERFLAKDASQHPVALQLGGSDPDGLAQATALATQAGFDEINLNCGCPSDRVQSGNFGACLMRTPELVRDCIAAMRDATDKPVTVKCRLGVDDDDSYDLFKNFVDTVAQSGCDHFVVHARNAWLQGLSPKENREIPPLKYDWAYRLKQEQPDWHIALNGL